MVFTCNEFECILSNAILSYVVAIKLHYIQTNTCIIMIGLRKEFIESKVNFTLDSI